MRLVFYVQIGFIRKKLRFILKRREIFMLSSIGVPGLIIILVLALMLFGPSKLPQLGKAVGDTLREFKKSTRDIVEDVKEPFELEDKNQKNNILE